MINKKYLCGIIIKLNLNIKPPSSFG
uniref:Uncharacterized protein n=1 Tax=Anguilla anguilla TaxID=7936 RepID=A0A0E9SI14_ANGAN